jgi:hypothetical protein
MPVNLPMFHSLVAHALFGAYQRDHGPTGASCTDGIGQRFHPLPQVRIHRVRIGDDDIGRPGQANPVNCRTGPGAFAVRRDRVGPGFARHGALLFGERLADQLPVHLTCPHVAHPLAGRVDLVQRHVHGRRHVARLQARQRPRVRDEDLVADQDAITGEDAHGAVRDPGPQAALAGAVELRAEEEDHRPPLLQRLLHPVQGRRPEQLRRQQVGARVEIGRQQLLDRIRPEFAGRELGQREAGRGCERRLGAVLASGPAGEERVPGPRVAVLLHGLGREAVDGT